MSPTSEYLNNTAEKDGERIVISGMSGIYPKASYVRDFSENLYNKINPIKPTDQTRWDFKHPELIEYVGNISGLDRFDSQFFKLSHRLGNTMDVVSRKLLEQTYQAIFDAGLSPDHLAGKSIGVFIGNCFSETEKVCFYSDIKVGSGLVGCSKSMFANRISYWLDLKGPSFTIDESCCSSIGVLEAAYLSMVRGECEAAIVGAGHLAMHPQTLIHYSRLLKFSADGKTRSFDANADGSAKSEAINVLYLQRAQDALRIYADLIHVKSEYCPAENMKYFGFYREPSLLAEYLKQFYDEAKISPQEVQYVEAFGSATPDADKAELEAIDKVFTSNKKTLLVGSVMSNIGYTEAASGIASITKVLLGYHEGRIAANMHCENPRQDVEGIREGRLQVVTDHSPINDSYTAINNLSYNGINAHVLLKGRFKPKDLSQYKTNIPRLVTISGRQEHAVKSVLDDLKSRPIDAEELALLHHIHEKRISGHLGRGYTVLDTKEDDTTVCLGEKAEYYDDSTRPLWFIYSGMGSQWNEMGTQLMRIPVFAETIQRCHKTLESVGVDLMYIITSPDKEVFENVQNAFIGIAAVQIGLTEVLRLIGLEPDKCIGHSLGEIGCGYVDGCFTMEEAIMVAYMRGKVSKEVPVVHGAMAAIGLGGSEMENLCPPDIYVACRNGPDSCTLSGPSESITTFVNELTEKGIFAKMVNTGNIAYHSKYIKNMDKVHLNCLKSVIKSPKLRSDRWISSSVPKEKWDEDEAKYCSAEYHNNNMMRPVLFEEALKLVPSNAVLIEVAPHGLLQAILKRSLSSECHNIPLTKRGHEDNVAFLLNAIGRTYIEGYNPKIANLYPKVKFPVSTKTPFLSHLVKWTHDEKWNLPLYISGERMTAAATKHLVTLHDEEYKYLRGNVVRGKIVYPFAAALVATWDTLALTLGLQRKEISVQFRDVHLFAQPMLHEQRLIKLTVILHRGSGKFEVSEDKSKVATGFILGNIEDVDKPDDPLEIKSVLDLQSDDIYELLDERGYNYNNSFRSIYKANTSLTEAQLVWTDWVTLLDGMFQLNTLKYSLTASQPTYIRRICIDIDNHFNTKMNVNNKEVMIANLNEVHDYTWCGGIVMDNIKLHNLPPLTNDSLVVKTSKFVPFSSRDVIDIDTALATCIQLVEENVDKDEITVLGILDDEEDHTTFDEIKQLIANSSSVVEINVMSKEDVLKTGAVLEDTDLVLVWDLASKANVRKALYKALPNSFIVNLHQEPEEKLASTRLIASFNIGKCYLQLLGVGLKQRNYATAVSVNTDNDLAMLTSQLKCLPLDQGLLVISISPSLPELKDTIKRWRKKYNSNKISMVVIDRDASNDANLNQVPKVAFSALNQVWGGDFMVPLKEDSSVPNEVTLRSRIGDLATLQWVEVPKPSGSGVLVKVHYAGLNDCDIKRATGVIPFRDGQDIKYGMDYSGLTESNERVMGVISGGSVSSTVLAHPELLWNVPKDWSLEDAATVPLAYCLAFYCLNIRTEICPEMKVLILGGAGALGQAAISIALSYGCTVFTTVSDNNKKQLILKLFPQIQEKHIGYSRDIRFGDMVLRETQGEGCDIVLSCVTGGLRNISLNCCAFSGVTLDTVQLHSKEKYSFGLHHLTKQRSYMPVDFSSIFTYNYVDDMKKLQELVNDGISRGFVRPLTHVSYGPADVVSAFKLLESSRRSGRVLIKMCDPIPLARSRFTCSSESVHVVICDRQGVQLVDKLISHGAKKVRLHCLHPPGYLALKVSHWRKSVDIEISTGDLNEEGIQKLLDNSKGPVEGIYTITTKSSKEIQIILNNVDKESRQNCPYLKYFLIACKDNIFNSVYKFRIEDKLPVTVMHLPEIKTDDRLTVPWIAAIEAMERALNSSETMVQAYIEKPKIASLLNQLTSIADIKITEDTAPSETLRCLGVPDFKMQAIAALFRDSYNLHYDEKQIALLTLEKIRELDEILSWSGFQNVRGLKTFFSNIDPDEVLGSTAVVHMKTQTNYTRVDEFDSELMYLSIIPGVEGHHERFRHLCERLKLPALVLQPGLSHLQESPQELAHRYAQTLLNRLKLKKSFYLLGYESGVPVALEVAAILENKGLTGTVFCIGVAPDELPSTFKSHLFTTLKDDKFQDAVVLHISSLILEKDTVIAELQKEIIDVPWEEKVEICVEKLLDHSGHAAQYTRALMNAALIRTNQVINGTFKPKKVKSKVIFLRTSCNNVSDNLSEQSVTEYYIETPLGLIPQDLRCATIINQHLSSEVLELFEQNNLCETYIHNGNTFDFIQSGE